MLYRIPPTTTTSRPRPLAVTIATSIMALLLSLSLPTSSVAWISSSPTLFPNPNKLFRLPLETTTTATSSRSRRCGCFCLQSTKNSQNNDSPPQHTHKYRDDDDIIFLDQVQDTVDRVLSQYEQQYNTTNSAKTSFDNCKHFVAKIPEEQREAFSIARLLDKRLQSFHRNNDCPRCWLQRAHCICQDCPPLSSAMLPPQINVKVNRIFLLMHHKEICLAMDTAKMILASFPKTCRLVVAGIGPEYQDSMQEMLEAIDNNSNKDDVSNESKCLVLFPTEDAKTFQELLLVEKEETTSSDNPPTAGREKANKEGDGGGWDIIVIDGTWSQARKMHARYFPPFDMGGPRRVQLSESSLVALQSSASSSLTKDESENNIHKINNTSTSITAASSSSGRQLRRHPIEWRTISTMEATRLLLKDIVEAQQPQEHQQEGKGNDDATSSSSSNSDTFLEEMSRYQELANQAARKQLGPPRISAIRARISSSNIS